MDLLESMQKLILTGFRVSSETHVEGSHLMTLTFHWLLLHFSSLWRFYQKKHIRISLWEVLEDVCRQRFDVSLWWWGSQWIVVPCTRTIRCQFLRICHDFWRYFLILHLIHDRSALRHVWICRFKDCDGSGWIMGFNAALFFIKIIVPFAFVWFFSSPSVLL